MQTPSDQPHPQRTRVYSHLQGMFFRTARMLESGMKPVYIFDGKPPDAKKEELNRRFEKRGDATEDLEKVKEVHAAITKCRKPHRPSSSDGLQHQSSRQGSVQRQGIGACVACRSKLACCCRNSGTQAVAQKFIRQM